MRKKISKTLDINSIKIDESIQQRAAMCEKTIEKYTEYLMSDKKNKFPRIEVFECDGEYLLADGFHRYEAYKNANRKKISCSIYEGNRRDAIWYALSCNKTHGLPLTNKDKRKIVKTILDDEEWSKESSNRIADHCGVSHTFVDNLKKERNGNSEQESSSENMGEGKIEMNLPVTPPVNNPPTNDEGGNGCNNNPPQRETESSPPEFRNDPLNQKNSDGFFSLEEMETLSQRAISYMENRDQTDRTATVINDAFEAIKQALDEESN